MSLAVFLALTPLLRPHDGSVCHHRSPRLYRRPEPAGFRREQPQQLLRAAPLRSPSSGRTGSAPPGGTPIHPLSFAALETVASAKEIVQNILDTLPEEASLEEFQYHLYVRQRIEKGLQDIEAGRVVPHEEVERRMVRWRAK